MVGVFSSEKPIIVPTDLSSNGSLAFKHAGLLCKMLGCIIKPVYVIQDSDIWFPYVSNETVEEKQKLAESDLKEIIQKIADKHDCADYILEPSVVVGDVVDEIRKISNTASLIVMATNGRSGLSRLMIGSITRKMLNLSQVPVLVVDEVTRLEVPERILVPTDFSEFSTKVFPYALEFAKKTGSKIDLVHMLYTGPFQIRSDHDVFKKTLEKLNHLKNDYFVEISDQVHTETLLTSVSTGEALTNLINSRNYQMVFISTLGSTSLRNLLVGSVASNVIRLSDTAVFCLNPRGKAI